MNKVSPASMLGDDKGTALGFPKGQEAEKEKLLSRARKRMEKAITAESDNRKSALDDRLFKAGDQWPKEIMAQRNLDKRPCLTINKLPTFIHQIVNDQRQNRPSINISPVGDRGDPEVAKMYRGLIRFIERDCAADIAYDTAFDDAVTMGWGYWRILTEREAPDSFNLVLVVRRIRNPFTVYLDPAHQDPTAADAKWGFITEMMPRDEYEEKYPDADPLNYTEGGIGEKFTNWIAKDEVRIAEYFEVDYKTRKLVELDNGHVGWYDELDEMTLARIGRKRVQIVDERESRVPKVMWYKITANDVLMKREWQGSTIPIVKVVGDEIDIEGKVKYSGVIRHAKDPQRMFNYWRTAETELIALQPKSPWVVEEGQIEGHEDEWKNANVKNMPYLSYKGTSVGGTQAPPPQRQPMAGIPAGVVQAGVNAGQDMMATTGIRFDATMNERMIDESGKAIRELRRSGDLGSFHYVDNLARALKRTGEIFVEVIPKIYDDPRVVTILREDDKEEQVKVDPTLGKAMGEEKKADGKTRKLFNPKFGKYGVTVTIGPSYATKRIEAAENMMAFMKALPQTAALVADLFAKNQDWPGAEEIATRLAKTIPPGLMTPDMKDVPPQVQAVLTQQEQALKELTQQLQAAMAALQDKKEDRALEAEKIQKDFEAKLIKIVSDVETKMAAIQEKASANFNTHIAAQISQLGEGVTSLMHALEEPDAANDEEAEGADGAGGAGQDASPADDTPPPEALQHLRPDRVTTFRNGQKWTLGPDGKPARAA
ncbi:MAG TPA: portal protein [Verrucomicrobiae bacterium]|nr:portal protein [Verrucomicrobiae bacterium]